MGCRQSSYIPNSIRLLPLQASELTLSLYGNSEPPFLTGEVNSANTFVSGFIVIRRSKAQFVCQSKFNIKQRNRNPPKTTNFTKLQPRCVHRERSIRNSTGMQGSSLTTRNKYSRNPTLQILEKHRYLLQSDLHCTVTSDGGKVRFIL